ncbi:uncharacterized protein LOC143026981 [Oratosquilla oratoria]|uniref:uncharacterized protein LOC143026981 n=1 Tax=Oratosquilla oratoria TaxID=337810 RepID=UPI003F75C5D6
MIEMCCTSTRSLTITSNSVLLEIEELRRCLRVRPRGVDQNGSLDESGPPAAGGQCPTRSRRNQRRNQDSMMGRVTTHPKSSSKLIEKNICGNFATRILLQTVLVAFLLFVGWKVYLQTGQNYEQSQATEDINFEEHVAKICATNGRTPMVYEGVKSFFKFIMKPQDDHCYSWIEFGGEKIPIPSQNENECMDEVRKTKYICFNDEYEMAKDPCLVYSFGMDGDSQFERDMHMFSCEVHAFDHLRVVGHEHIRRTEFWIEHSWDIANFPYDQPGKNKTIQRRSLDFIAKTFGHVGKTIKFLKSDLEGREWILLKEIILRHDILNIQQIGVQIHIGTSVNKMSHEKRHEHFRTLFQILQGLTCLGYKYILGRSVNYYRERIVIPEMKNARFFSAYEVNFAKVLPTEKYNASA